MVVHSAFMIVYILSLGAVQGLLGILLDLTQSYIIRALSSLKGHLCVRVHCGEDVVTSLSDSFVSISTVTVFPVVLDWVQVQEHERHRNCIGDESAQHW